MAKELGPYKDVMANKSSLYALLVSAGYLKIASPIEEGMCKVALPNHELSFAFVNNIIAADSATDDLKALARDARALIDGKKYDATFRAEGITDIEKIGLAYFKDKVELCKEELTVHK